MSSQSYNSTLVLRQGINIQDDSREPNKGHEAKVKSGSLERALPLEDVSHREWEGVFVSRQRSKP